MLQLKQNNFDLLRLFAALQVAVVHTLGKLEVSFAWSEILNIFPGVPIFFFISGFLIFISFEKCLNDSNAPIKDFFFNRFIRLYPGLWGCVTITLVSIISIGFLDGAFFTRIQVWVWAVSMYIAPFYTPQFMDLYGTGAVNGALWTIAVEIQFYILMPILYPILGRKILLALLLLILVLANFINGFHDQKLILEKIYFISFLPWWIMFIIGCVFAKYSIIRLKIQKLRLEVIILLYIGSYFVVDLFELQWGAKMNLISYILAAIIVYRLAFCLELKKINQLVKYDLSYGIYIYHWIVINIFVQFDWLGLQSAILVLMVTFLLAFLSYWLIEAPALSMKKTSIKNIAQKG